MFGKWKVPEVVATLDVHSVAKKIGIVLVLVLN